MGSFVVNSVGVLFMWDGGEGSGRVVGRWVRRRKEFSDVEIVLGRRSEEIVYLILLGVSRVLDDIVMDKCIFFVCLLVMISDVLVFFWVSIYK